ncbi:chlorhexidine efflux transporter [Moraxella lacunata]|uniref:chlorhexidine efflux transporter n=1 Tax=Moraxella lacunata TaxID=477 RepID=UPI0035710F7E
MCFIRLPLRRVCSLLPFLLLLIFWACIAYLLGLTLWQAFLADVGLTVAITVYALIFNWIYDNIRLKFIGKKHHEFI